MSLRTRALVLARDEMTCQFDGRDLTEQVPRGEYSLQHRRARGMGGTSDPEANDAANLVLMCGSGTTGCHGYVEQHREHGRRRGFTLGQHERPVEVSLQDWRGDWWFLNPDGTRLAVPPAGVTG